MWISSDTVESSSVRSKMETPELMGDFEEVNEDTEAPK